MIDRTILQTARNLFFREGFDLVSMDGVASAAGVSKGTLYARYRSKEDLLFAVTDLYFAESVVPDADYMASLPTDTVARLRAHARQIAISLANPDQLAFQRLLVGIGPPKLKSNVSSFPARICPLRVHGN